MDFYEEVTYLYHYYERNKGGEPEKFVWNVLNCMKFHILGLERMFKIVKR